MHVYKYPPHGTAAQTTWSRDPSPVFQDTGLKVSVWSCVEADSCRGSAIHSGPVAVQMICSRCVVPILALYVLLEEASAAALPSRFRSKRVGLQARARCPLHTLTPLRPALPSYCCPQKVSWLEQEAFPSRLDGSEQRDVSVGDSGETGRAVNDQPSRSETFLPPAGRLPVKHQSQNHRRANEKR